MENISNNESVTLEQKIRDAYLSIAKSLKLQYSEDKINSISARIYIDSNGDENLIFVNRHGKTPSNSTLDDMYQEIFGYGRLYENRKIKWEIRKSELSDDCTVLTVVSFFAIRALMTGSMRNRLSMKLMSMFIRWLDGDL